MDLPQNGESSKSPFHLIPTQAAQGDEMHAGVERRDGDGDVEMSDGRADGPGEEPVSGADTKEQKRGTARLILPQWDIPPPKPIHSSQDLISLLNLDTLYNAYVRPFADLPGESDQPNGVGGDDGKGGGKKKGPPGRRKMEKGYQHLVEDCIDPIPLGTRVDAPSFLPLLNDVLHPPAPPPPFAEGIVEELPKEAFKVARLEAGSQEGYHGGQKAGVREAEEKRRRKRAARTATHDPISPIQSTFHPNIQSTGGCSSTPGTPMLPVPLPINVRPYHTPGTPRRGTAPPGTGTGQGVHPFSKLGPGGSGAGGRPTMPSSKQRPASMEVPNSRKAASRSASPLPPSSLGPGGGGAANQQRPFAANRNKRPGSADVQGGPGKRAKENGSASPLPGLRR
ncbi:hypothetical protein I350_00654 [Cryptococcus amylolentus CBS 6273]|uniref:Mediator of RNA polymerase II transcription subunit 19 n=1 Tax=Cryptococcus amylolentus CBS 6273 TaxID=1296118 RepID=A0A1E3KFL2_9TREE|nr:hypothetical protein I350_00654 [Cryptococcus amylolentus CBS 6273]